VAYVKLDALEQSFANRRFRSWMSQLTPEAIGRRFHSAHQPVGKL
jgi:hypothetical protein